MLVSMFDTISIRNWNPGCLRKLWWPCLKNRVATCVPATCLASNVACLLLLHAPIRALGTWCSWVGFSLGSRPYKIVVLTKGYLSINLPLRPQIQTSSMITRVRTWHQPWSPLNCSSSVPDVASHFASAAFPALWNRLCRWVVHVGTLAVT